MTRSFRKLAFPLMLATVVFGGDALAGGSGGKSVTRPMAGGCETEFQFTGEATISLAGECHFRHLGLVSVTATQHLTFHPEGVAIVHESVYTAADGEQLFATVSAWGRFMSPTAVTFTGTESYAGGTGRFLNASGGGDVVGGAQFTGPGGGVGSFCVNGHLAY